MNRIFDSRIMLAALGLLGLATAACEPTIETPEASAGNASFSRYIAVGNSLTAGFSDNGLYREGQLNSYPNILAQQFAQAGGGEFNQPLFSEAQANGSGFLRLTGFSATGTPVTAFTPGNGGRANPASLPYTKYLTRVDNLGVPGIQLNDIHTLSFGSLAPLRAYNASNFNPFFERITPDGNSQSYFQRVKAEAATATFFSCWLGNNDVLGYATAGGAGAPPTRADSFNLKAVRVINALTGNGAKGIVATIPDVTGVPFFTTVGPAFRATLTANNAPGVVITTGGFNFSPTGAPPTRRSIPTNTIRDASGNGTQLFTLTASPYLPLFNRPNTGRAWRDVYNQVRPQLPATVTLGVFLTLQGVDTTQAFGASPGNPIPSTLVLDDTEQGVVATATSAFNNSLVNAANAKGLAIFDANGFFRGVAATGLSINANTGNTAAFLSGNLFSLDGVHPTPRGYAVVANEMIRAINAKYSSSVPLANPNNYRGVQFPQ